MECNVIINEVLVGTLARGDGRKTVFTYNEEYLAAGGRAIAPGMPTSSPTHVNEGLHPYFTNLLSEGWLKAQHDQFVHTAGKDRVHRLDGLLYFSHYFGKSALRGGRIVPKDPLNEEWLRRLELVRSRIPAGRTMLPGVQPKLFVVRRNEEGLFEACDPDEATHIAKREFDKKDEEKGFLSGMVDNEHLSMNASRVLNPIRDDQVASVEIVEVINFGRSIVVERFDKKIDGYTPRVLDFCQLLGIPPDRRYDSFYHLMTDFIKKNDSQESGNHFKTDKGDAKRLVGRLLRNILIGNMDTHLKNFSLMEGRDGIWRLTPDYDIVCGRVHNDAQFALFFDRPNLPRFSSSSAEINKTTGDFSRTDDASTEARDHYKANISSFKHKQLRTFLKSFSLTDDEQRELLSGLAGQLQPTKDYIASADAPDEIKAKMLQNMNARWTEAFQPCLEALQKDLQVTQSNGKNILPSPTPERPGTRGPALAFGRLGQ